MRVDPRLPDGGGYPITLWEETEAAAGLPADRYVTFETDFGPARTDYWHGVDVTFNARMRTGLVFSGGTSTGRKVTDDCATTVNIDSPDTRNCHDADPFQTTFRGLASYTIPMVDVLVSATMRSEPPLSLSASWRVPNTMVRDLLGRLPAGASARGNTTVELTDTEHRLFADNRRTQIDMRFAKIVRFGRTRTDIGVDVYNLLNTNYATSYQSTYSYTEPNGGSWNNPTAIYSPRFVRLNFTVNF